jgi:hypothetical protein
MQLQRIRYMATLPRRWWRSKGFGIHSPFAFEYVNEVIAQPCHYYAYSETDIVAKRCRVSRRLTRLLSRVAIRCWSPSAVCLGTDSWVEEVLKASRSDIAILRAPRTDTAMFILGNVHMPEVAFLSPLDAISSCEATIVLLGVNEPHSASATAFSRLKQELQHGMTFSDGYTAIVITNSKLPRQDFILRL